MRRLLPAFALAIALLPCPAPAGVLEDCTQTGDWWLRVSAFTEAIESGQWEGPAASWAYSNRAVARAALGDYIAAFDDHARAVALNPADAVAHNNTANTHADFREYRRALEAYDRALELRPDYTNARYNRAGVYLALGEFAAAIDDYSAVIAAEPDFGEAWAGRAEAACRQGLVGQSVADRLRAIRLGALTRDQTAAYLRQTGYLRAPDPVPESALESALATWTANGCP